MTEILHTKLFPLVCNACSTGKKVENGLILKKVAFTQDLRPTSGQVTGAASVLTRSTDEADLHSARRVPRTFAAIFAMRPFWSKKATGGVSEIIMRAGNISDLLML